MGWVKGCVCASAKCNWISLRATFRVLQSLRSWEVTPVERLKCLHLFLVLRLEQLLIERLKSIIDFDHCLYLELMHDFLLVSLFL